MTALVLDGVSLWLGSARLLGPLDLTVRSGEVVTLMGPSGSGKSSLLSWLTGTLAPAFRAEGRISLDGYELTGLPPERRRLGILFQDDLLFPHMSVAGNLAFALPAGTRDRAGRIAAALAEAGLEGFEHRDPATLSGGQRARVAALRVLLSAPRALLLDEPFAKLDVALREQFRGFVFEHAVAAGLPVLLVTHDPADAAAAGGQILRLQAP